MQTAELSIETQPFSIQAKVAVTVGGLVAIGGLVSAILLSAAVIVRTARKERKGKLG